MPVFYVVKIWVTAGRARHHFWEIFMKYILISIKNEEVGRVIQIDQALILINKQA